MFLKANLLKQKWLKDLENVTSEINSIKSKICMNIVAQQKKVEKKVSEINSRNSETDVEDIFSEVCTENKTEDKDLNIF